MAGEYSRLRVNKHPVGRKFDQAEPRYDNGRGYVLSVEVGDCDSGNRDRGTRNCLPPHVGQWQAEI